MDIEDPIRKLLSTTGWSCDDLLEKLQKFKSNTNAEESVSSKPGSSVSSDSTQDVSYEINGNKNNVEQSEETSTESSTISSNRLTSSDQTTSSLASDTNEDASSGSNPTFPCPSFGTNTSQSQIITNGSSIMTKVAYGDCNTSLEFPTIANTYTTSSTSATKSDSVLVVNGDFSDTDEEEDEVNNTNTSIINEIIEDIDKGDNLEALPSVTVDTTEAGQATEITEVRVIEIKSDDDEDDNFEDESYNPSDDTINSMKEQYIEVHPRRSLDDLPESVIPEVIDNASGDGITESIAKSQPREVEESSTVAQTVNEDNDAAIHIEDSEDSDEIIDNTDKIVIINDDTGTCLDSSSVALCLTKMVDNIQLEKIPDTTKNAVDKIKILDNYLIESARTDTNSTPEGTVEEENANPGDLEDIRNNLKKQLSCLRRRKKEHFLKDLTSKLDNTFECNEKISNFSKTQPPVEVEKTKLDNSALYTQTNELGFVIASVEGGVELDDSPKDIIPPTVDESNTNKDETSPHQDNQVFDEIRRIINKQKTHTPRIFVNKQLAKPPEHFFTNVPNILATSSPETSQLPFTIARSPKQISPFVSNTLDEFLTADAKLNISYNVPKSGAEDGLKEKFPTDVSPLLLKRVVKIKEDVQDLPDKTPLKKMKAKTVAQKRKLLEMEHKKKLKQMKKENTKLKVGVKKSNGYVIVDGQKLWVKSSTPNTCIVTIKSPESRLVNSRQRKLSLLKKEKHHKKLKYLPGPLCKKRQLQMNGLANWDTQLRTLPKINLEVEPRIGEPICHIARCRLPPCDGTITSDQIDFALTMLKMEPVDTKKFVFPMHYRNHQEQVVVKTRRATSPPLKYDSYQHKDEQTIEDTVADVIQGLIQYVEIKEIAPTLLKPDPIEIEDEPKLEQQSNQNIDDKIVVFKKPTKKKSKVDMELFRLSCKVVNVEVEDKDEEKCCTKPYCRLGCVCKSIKCEHIPNLHCQKVKCMFECTCPKGRHWSYDNKLTLPAGSDLLATDTVTRIEDEAKRNLAKVERDFTQTVIYTNDKTIVVGLGSRNRSRRQTKAPRKYADYYDTFQDLNEPDERDFLRANCSVSLPRLNLSDIVPFCLEHNLYNCHCEGRSDYIPRKHKDSSVPSTRSLQPKYAIPIEVKRVPTPNKSNVQEMPPVEDNSSEIIGYEFTTRAKRKQRWGTKFAKTEEHVTYDAARLNPVPFHNKRRRHANACKYDFINNITDADIYKARVQSMDKNKQQLEVDILKQYLIELAQTSQTDEGEGEKDYVPPKKKRKQILEVRKDDAPQKAQNMAMQRRKKVTTLRHAPLVVTPVFDGEIIVDNNNMELLKKMGPKTVQDGYARLLPWKSLSEAYRNGSIIIWSMIGQPSRLLMNKSDKKAPKNYIDIKETTHTTEVILWILRNKLPPIYQEENVSFILRETKDNFEICGVCTKNLKSSLSEDTTATVKTRGSVTSFVHKDSQGISQVMDLVKKKFKLQELMEESLGALGDTSVKPDKLYMWVELPDVHRFYKWKMIYLNSDFAYLFFNNTKYSIKYTDLITAGRISKNSGCTVILKNEQLQYKHDHKHFGLYFDPNYLDRLFIGPYPKQYEEVDVETMRYINQTLVCTESFNKMRGKGDYKCGYWLIERPYSKPNRYSLDSLDSTIDLTMDDNIDDAGEQTKHRSEPCNIFIMHNNEQVKIIDAPPRKPEDFNRYLITNIPHFGYLGAYQHLNSTDIDVSWPFENKMLRFPNVTTALDFLQERFSTLLQPVPATFKIHIIVLTTIDFTNSKPIDANVLNGHFICGEFGYYNILQITDKICYEKIGKSKEHVLRMFAKKAQEIVRKRASTLCSLLGENTPNKNLDIVRILDSATEEIKKLREQDKQQIALKTQLSNEKKNKAIKLFNMIGRLPDEERNKECIKFRTTINNTETIEIDDSDDEQTSKKSKKSVPAKLGSTKRQSLLKPLIRVPIDQATSLLARGETPSIEQISSTLEDSKSNLPGRLIKGVKLIKTSTGNFVIVSDNSQPSVSKQLCPGTKIVIKNSRIQHVSTKVDNRDHLQELSDEADVSKLGAAEQETAEKVVNDKTEPVQDPS